MNSCLKFAHHVSLVAFEIADAIHSGEWCHLCSDFADARCKAGTCQVVEYEPDVDHRAFQHEPVVDFGGGD